MYSTCLFCNSTLGRNESLEHFPVGRRLAWDMAKGRLWVVCRRCERWNLTPLEARWEAMEEAERAFRATRQRVATDNIALARLREGLELVRVGAPPRLELATWRYGDQFGRRRRRHATFIAAGGLITASPILGALWGPAALGASVATVGFNVLEFRLALRWTRVPVVWVRGDQGRLVGFTRRDLWSARFSHVGEVDDWCLTVERAELPLPRFGYEFAAKHRVTLRGNEALRALTSALAQANFAGAGRKRVRAAVDTVARASTLRNLLSSAADAAARRGRFTNTLGWLKPPLRLALEMALHEDDERRAMEGELAALENRWREAEQIAEIADSLLVPAATTARLEGLRQSRDAGTTSDTPAQGGTR